MSVTTDNPKAVVAKACWEAREVMLECRACGPIFARNGQLSEMCRACRLATLVLIAFSDTREKPGAPPLPEGGPRAGDTKGGEA